MTTTQPQRGKSACPDCRDNPGRSHRYCAACKASHMRHWRRTHPLTPEQRQKANCRSAAKVYLKRGKIHKQACQDCGRPDSQMHHPDYTRPKLVVWLCRPCHLQLHANPHD